MLRLHCFEQASVLSNCMAHSDAYAGILCRFQLHTPDFGSNYVTWKPGGCTQHKPHSMRPYQLLKHRLGRECFIECDPALLAIGHIRHMRSNSRVVTDFHGRIGLLVP